MTAQRLIIDASEPFALLMCTEAFAGILGAAVSGWKSAIVLTACPQIQNSRHRRTQSYLSDGLP
jgi:hypothetical protein